MLFEHEATGLFGENVVQGVRLLKRRGQPDETGYILQEEPGTAKTKIPTARADL